MITDDRVSGADQTWPLIDVLEKLAQAADHLLKDHDCDQHGYEEVEVCVAKAREYAAIAKSTPMGVIEPKHCTSMTLDELLERLEKVKKVASGKTCVSFETMVWGACSLWHQDHHRNAEAAKKHPNVLSEFILEKTGRLCRDNAFLQQVVDYCELMTKTRSEKEQAAARIKYVPDVMRREDMSRRGFLRILRQGDGDIIVAIASCENDTLSRTEAVEFCTGITGGGKSPHTFMALRRLAEAMDQDNQEDPERGKPCLG